MNRAPQTSHLRFAPLLPLLLACLWVSLLSACSTTVASGGGGGGAVLSAGAMTPAAARLAADVGTMSALSFGPKTDADRARAALYVQSVAGAVRSLSGGQAPSVAQFDAAIRLWAPQADPVFGRIAAELSGIYGSYFPALTADGRAATVLAYLEAIATGVEDAARPYLVTVAGPASPLAPWLPFLAVLPPLVGGTREGEEDGSPLAVLQGKSLTPGWKTTEFWISAISMAASLLTSAAGMLPPKYAVLATAFSGGLYAVSRGLAKQG